MLHREAAAAIAAAEVARLEEIARIEAEKEAATKRVRLLLLTGEGVRLPVRVRVCLVIHEGVAAFIPVAA